MSIYSDYVDSLNPTTYWRLGESPASGTAVDSANSYDGTYVGPPTSVSGLVTGDTDTAVDFSGGSNYVSTGPITRISQNEGALVSLVNVSSLADTNYIYSEANLTQDEFIDVGINVDGAVFIQFLMRAPDIHDVYKTPDGVISVGTNYHIIAQSVGSSYQIYIDGVLQSGVVLLGTDSGNWFGDSQVGANANYIGQLERTSGLSTENFDCTLDELSLHPLSVSQVDATGLYDASIGLSSNDIIAVGDFSEVTGASIVDVDNPHIVTADGVFSEITGVSDVDVDYPPVSVSADGTFSEITGASDVDVVIPPVSVSAQGSFSSITATAYLYDPLTSSLVFMVGGVEIDHSVIHGVIEVLRAENEESILNISLISEPGVQDVSAWMSKPVVLEVDGVRVFAGTVNTPQLDVVNKRVVLSCTDDRNKKINDLPDSVIESVGYYSASIFDKTANNTEIIEQRLTTAPLSLDFDAYGNYSISNINPKATADITLAGSDIYRKTLNVSITSAQRVVNNAVIVFDYRYTRLRQRERNFKIEDLSFCDILDLGALGSFTLKDTFLGYAGLMSWPLKPGSIVWEEMPFSTGSTSPPCTVDIVYVQNPRFATSMEFIASKRFAQTVTERFNIAVKAPQSITTYGVKTWQQEHGHEFEYDSTQFESDSGYLPPTGMNSSDSDYYIDQEGSQPDFENAILTAENIGYTKVIRTHRDTQISFETPLRTDIDLTKTIDVNSSRLTAKGKVSSISHFFDVNTRHDRTKITISFSTADGTQVSDTIGIPPRAIPPVISDPWTDPIVMLISDGNVVTPEIDATSRESQISESDVTYNVEITNDPFQVSM